MFAKGMFEGRQAHSMVLEPTSNKSPEEKQLCKSISSRTIKERGAENPAGWPLGLSAENGTKSRPSKDAGGKDKPSSGKYMFELSAVK